MATRTSTKKPAKKSAKKVASSASITPPNVGEYWKGQGGMYAGIRRLVENGITSFYHLIVGAVSDESMTFAAAGTWIEKQSVDGHKDFVPPNRGDGRLIDANLDRLPISDWFWLEQHADHGDYAWLQDFGHGDQDYWYKTTKSRARAVRRLTIQ